MACFYATITGNFVIGCGFESHCSHLKIEHYFRSSHLRYSVQKGVTKNFAISRDKHLCWSFVFIEKRLQHRCFPMNIAKFLKKIYFEKRMQTAVSIIFLVYILFLIFFTELVRFTRVLFQKDPSKIFLKNYTKSTENLFLCIFVVDNASFEALPLVVWG